MDEKKVAIVIDNSLQISKDLSLEIAKQYESPTIFNFAELSSKEFSLIGMINNVRLIYKLEKLDLSEFDLVYSLSTGFANGIITNLDTKHINVFVGFPIWYFEANNTFLKHRIRNWIAYATNRAEKNFASFEAIKNSYLKLNNSIKFAEGFSFKSIELSAGANEKEEYVLVTERQTSGRFIEECIKIFNQTGKKLNLIGHKKLPQNLNDFSEYVQFVDINDEVNVLNCINNAKAVVFDNHFNDYEFLVKNLKKSVPVLSYKNEFINELFNKDILFEFYNIDSFENEFAKFVSWVKTKSDKVAKIKSLDFKKLDIFE